MSWTSSRRDLEFRETDCRQWPCSHVITDTCRYHWSSKPVVLLRRGCNSVLRASVLISPHIFRRRWRHSTRISCFIHRCGLRDRCPSCHRGITAFAQPRLVGQHVCTSCAYDLRRASKVPVTIEAQYFEQIINRSIGTVANILATNNPPKWPWRQDLIAVLPTMSVSSRIRLFERFIPDDAYLDEGFVLPIRRSKRILKDKTEPARQAAAR